jgi:polysaccharide export outer membrane protein
MSFNCGLLALLLICAGSSAQPSGSPQSEYVLGIDDQLTVRIQDLPDIPDKPYRVAPSGSVDLPLLGTVRAAGLTVPQFKTAVADIAGKYIADPQVSVNVTEYQSQPVSVMGAVNGPGVRSLSGPKRLLEVISMAGGLRPDAGGVVRITRESAWGELLVPGARTSLSGEYSMAEIDLEALISGRDPSVNILVRPHDFVSVSKAELLYVLGEVKKAGGFPISSKDNMTVLKAISLAGGLERSAAPKSARIIRPAQDGAAKTEISVNIQRILDGKNPDLAMRAEDTLFVPNNVPHSIGVRAAETALQVGTGIVIWRR